MFYLIISACLAGSLIQGPKTHLSQLQRDAKIINVMAFGATGNAVRNDGPALQRAISFAESRRPGVVLFFPPAAGYKTEQTISVGVGVDIEQKGPIVCLSGPCLVVGAAGQTNANRVFSGLDTRRDTLSPWTREADVGLRVINCDGCKIVVRRSTNFTIGVQFIGDGSGFSYNTTTFGYLIGNKIGLDLTQANSGWQNENLFRGGRFTVLGGAHPTLDRVGVRIGSQDNTYLNANNNVFVKPSFEYAGMTTGEAVPILLETGSQNSFLYYRVEGTMVYAARVLGNATENLFRGGFDQGKIIDDQSLYSNNIQLFSRQGFLFTHNRTIARYQLRVLRNEVSPTDIRFEGLSFLRSTGYPLQGHATGGFALQADGSVVVGGTTAIGFVVDTSVVKTLVLTKGVPASRTGGRFIIRAMDSAGNRLGNADPSHPYVKGPSNSTPAYFTRYGGIYSEGADSTIAWIVKMGEDVKSIWIGITRGTESAFISSLAVQAAMGGPDPAVWSGLP